MKDSWKNIRPITLIAAVMNITVLIGAQLVIDVSKWSKMERFLESMLVSHLVIMWVNYVFVWAGYDQNRRRMEAIEAKLEIKAQ